MRRVAFLISVTLTFVAVITFLVLWLTGVIFIRLPGAIITSNGTVSDRNAVYKSGNGDSLIFIEDNGRAMTYMVSSQTNQVGIPNRPIPSSFSRSIRTGWFVFCWYTESAVAGTGKLDRNASLKIQPNQITFRVYEDTIHINY
jgi:hypothetical protein